jgi:filamentous hemagglutinin family protein
MLALPGFLSQWPAAANPTHPVVTQGSATFSTQGPQLTIHTTANTLINWSGFNIGAGQTTTFVEPSSTSVVWNHISDPNPTQILGHLDANGYVVLQNQSGFYIGGNAVINAAGLVMTTTPAVPLDVFGGGSWQFTAPPPTASIINYGEINAGPGGSVFLISRNIENHGGITAPGGSIGLCAGEQVLMSPRADGRGFSAAVTLPQGSVDNSGKLIADAGTIALNAQVVNQGGLIQANSVRERDGTIELVAADQLNLGPNSQITARGDDSTPGSPGGSVTLKSGNTFADSVGSQIITTGGAQGGNGGNVEVCAPNILSLNSSMDASAQPGSTSGQLFLDPKNITLSATGATASSGTVNEGDAPATGTLKLNPNSLNSFSRILLQASQNITLSTPWTLLPTDNATTLTLEAGNNITFNTGDSLTVENGCSVTLIAGVNNFSSGKYDSSIVAANATAGSSSITLSGTASVQTTSGNITLIAGGGITTGMGIIQSTGGGNITLQQSQSITVGITSPWTLQGSPSGTSPTLTLQSGNDINLNGSIMVGQNWNVTLIAGANVNTGIVTANAGSISLNGSAEVQSVNGNITLNAGGSVTVANGSITTTGGGSINVNAVAGNVNAGQNAQNPNGYDFNYGVMSVDGNLGGISTAAGGNVTIIAGGSVTSFLPSFTAGVDGDAGSGAFGPEPGVVTITAGGDVTGHYVAANSPTPSTITAGTAGSGDAGTPGTLLALSLATGSWVVNAPNGSINLQEVRNPNGTLNDSDITKQGTLNNVFNYSPDASVTLNAGNAVNLLGTGLPRQSGDDVPCLYPPSLYITAGAGGVTLGTSSSGSSVILFPSPDGELTVNTTGSFEGNGLTLAMSDSGATRWIGSGADATDFIKDHAATPIQLNNTQPVVFNIAGDLDDVTLVMPKETQVTVGGNMNNVSFTGQNLHSSDTTFFDVAGEIYDQNIYALETLSAPLALPAPLYPNAVQNYLQILQNAVIPGSGPSSAYAGALFPSLDLFYLPGTQQLGYYGIMTSAVEALLLGTLQEKTYTLGGEAVLNAQGDYVTTPATFAANSGSTQQLYQAIQALYAASQNSVNPPAGIVIGGPGQLNITAQSMNLGASTYGVSSEGPAVNHALATITGNGAAININLTGDLDMFASQISSWYGGAIDINVGDSAADAAYAAAGFGAININASSSINIGLAGLPFQGTTPHGIWTSADSDISITAQGDVNVQGSRIAAYDGGNIFVESLEGNVDAGTGGLGEVLVNEAVVNPKTGAVTTPAQPIAGSGILATTMPNAPRSLEVGNITVDAPHGNIDAALGGITQEPNNGNASLAPTVDLNAGGNINAGNTGVIAINVNAQATGGITGLFISSGNSTIHGDTLNVTDLAGGTASLSASGSITGTVIAGGGISIGSGSFAGVALSQSVSGGGAQSALASAASASAGSQTSAAGEASSQKTETSLQPASTATDDDLKRARAHPLLAKYTGRVTVLLPAAK